jgi:hypothetical protein
MNDQFEDKMNDQPEEDKNSMDDEPKEQHPDLSLNWDISGIPLEVISDDGSLLIGHPVFMVAIDSATRTVLGTHMHFESPDAEQA